MATLLSQCSNHKPATAPAGGTDMQIELINIQEGLRRVQCFPTLRSDDDDPPTPGRCTHTAPAWANCCGLHSDFANHT
eukprot:549787-Pyramimonas_sp.AAC.1